MSPHTKRSFSAVVHHSMFDRSSLAKHFVHVWLLCLLRATTQYVNAGLTGSGLYLSFQKRSTHHPTLTKQRSITSNAQPSLEKQKSHNSSSSHSTASTNHRERRHLKQDSKSVKRRQRLERKKHEDPSAYRKARLRADIRRIHNDDLTGRKGEETLHQHLENRVMFERQQEKLKNDEIAETVRGILPKGSTFAVDAVLSKSRVRHTCHRPKAASNVISPSSLSSTEHIQVKMNHRQSREANSDDEWVEYFGG